MAERRVTLSLPRIQSQSHALASIHAWILLKAACGHSRPFFDDGPASLPEELCAPICPILADGEVSHA